MFEMAMEPIKVFVNEGGNVCISQFSFGQDDNDIIMVPKDQIDILIGYLSQAKESII